MSMVHVKICGLTSLEDARWAVNAGADLLGFNFYPPSPRFIRPEDCARILEQLRQELKERLSPVLTAGVFVNANPGYIAQVLETCGLDLAQLSGDEPPGDLQVLGHRAFKGLHPSGEPALQEALSRYPLRSSAPAWLVDAYRPGEFGGTGSVADWSLAAGLAKQAPILLAGGLSASNVAAAIRQVHPWGVDVASGVESAPGVKDPQKVTAFVSAARSMDQEEPK